MIALYLFAALASVIVYLATARLRPLTRTVVALSIFLVPSAGLTSWVLVVGDRAPSDAVTVSFD